VKTCTLVVIQWLLYVEDEAPPVTATVHTVGWCLLHHFSV